MWQDMGIYWAWRGSKAPASEPPTIKVLEYEQFAGQRICSAVVEGSKRTEVFAAERARHKGAN